jgi:hypothetical protein
VHDLLADPESGQYQLNRIRSRILPMLLDDLSWKIFYYYSITTLTALGYGDITPIQPFARNLAMIKALVGQLYSEIFLARLVSLRTQTRQSKK